MELSTSIGLLAFFVFLTVMFGSYAVFAPVVNQRKQKIGTDIFREEELQVDSSDSIAKYVRPIVDNILPQLPIKLSDQRRKGLAHIIHTSGNPWRVTPEELIAVQVGLGILGVLAGSLLAIMPGFPDQIPPLILPIFFGVAGAALPFSRHNSLREARMKSVEKELPEALDLITITVGTAGETFESGLKSVTVNMADNTLRKEFIQCVAEMESGQTTRDVLTSFYKRFDSKDLEAFCKAIIQSKELGNDPTRTLEQQADFIRTNYEARLERMIGRLETTMFIPLIATMLPAFILIFIAPTMMTLSEYLG